MLLKERKGKGRRTFFPFVFNKRGMKEDQIHHPYLVWQYKGKEGGGFVCTMTTLSVKWTFLS